MMKYQAFCLAALCTAAYADPNPSPSSQLSAVPPVPPSLSLELEPSSHAALIPSRTPLFPPSQSHMTSSASQPTIGSSPYKKMRHLLQTPAPTDSPSAPPSKSSEPSKSLEPSNEPSASPSKSSEPSASPSKSSEPSNEPSASPSTISPTSEPTLIPTTEQPTGNPTVAPTLNPTTEQPTMNPTTP
eukprot:CAMPEP_0113423326 /NCGR_PEP_ID=MMETSP0013_2-20120614/28954_1 /TAXON_ID=2843 ORGANISM="Skeletonema costatum, Strain 1716" /NCGR_SAMPLE_ID=MMETSP0013_2 /ASSEMBLY_ACC=CAM_ASM_000158 /LENGTH=185 /DNA_ID=CAMNT_0000311169 /DNA_START=102 /DNA_END=655 /DNA_ORIENTATION=+ /assembly_acc=CAM_ASM_000158